MNKVAVVKRGFGSDNHAAVHPEIMHAIIDANIGHAPSYGTDDLTLKAEKMFCQIFTEKTESFFVFNGTAANVLALSTCVESHHAVFASQFSHMINDECGAPEKNLGCKIISVPSNDGKITVDEIKKLLVRRGDQHFSQAKMISITQPTELGTVYRLDEIRAICAFAHHEGLLVHLDGARLVNAAASLGCSLREMTSDCGVDVVSFGGTKNGLMFGEAVLFFRPELAQNFKYKRKQLMQLASKTRFLAAQFLRFLGTDLWRENATHANQMAALLAKGLSRPELQRFVRITQPVQANACFVCFPKKWIAALREVSFFYVWDEHSFECRLMTSWDTRSEDIDAFIARVSQLADAENND